MSNLFRNLAARGGLSFAHLGRGSRAEDDRPSDDDDSGKGKKGKRASDDEDDQQQDRDNGDSKKGKRAEGGDSDDDDEDDPDNDVDDKDDPDDDSGKGKRGKKGKRAADDDDDERAEEDDDDEEEMRGNSAAARARRRERARCAAIFASKGAGRNTVLAANLAFESTMTRSEAIAVLNKTPGSARGSQERRNPNLGSGDGPGMTSEQAVAASWDVAFQRAGSASRDSRARGRR
ncbi:hypothetical protein [Paraburkholderia nodosa]|uniref:hypothetical protein n=1 Tax=Paraburkholderia nodosa TaxID=392320 RepID=UPI000ADA06FF|nr:hypothetical protein [Paraburkholderia nodosa]